MSIATASAALQPVDASKAWLTKLKVSSRSVISIGSPQLLARHSWAPPLANLTADGCGSIALAVVAGLCDSLGTLLYAPGVETRKCREPKNPRALNKNWPLVVARAVDPLQARR